MHKIRSALIASVLISIFLFVLFMSCSGGGGSDLLAGGGIGGTGITVGSVSGFGSIIVIDSEYDTSTADIFVEGEFTGAGDQAVFDNLKKGMVVRVEGNFAGTADKTAASVFYNDNVEGPVDIIVPTIGNFLFVMGQPVIIDDNTNFVNTSFADIKLNNVLEVSGLVDFDLGQGFKVIRATYIEKKADFLEKNATVELKGIVQDLNETLATFGINMLEISYAGIIDKLPQGIPATGQLLEIKGKLSGNTLVADQITLENELGIDNAATVEIEGFVTEFFTLFDFDLGNLEIETDDGTIFDGLFPEEIEIGSKLVINGELIDGVLLAERIRLPF